MAMQAPHLMGAGKVRGSELSQGGVETIGREMKIFNA
jgi:hypothetical protein